MSSRCTDMNVTKIEALNRENYETWRIQVKALLVKNDEWEYVSGETPKPEAGASEEAKLKLKEWTKNDNKAMSTIILSISPAQLKQVKNCETSKELWLKLEKLFYSKGPARKVTLLNQLTGQRMVEGEDVKDHISTFFDIVDKLAEMNIDINADLLSVMLLQSLPPSYENFRCAIVSRDTLLSPEDLRVKIIEECDSRKTETRSSNDALAAQNKWFRKTNNNPNESGTRSFKYRCNKCKKIGHKAVDCKSKPSKVNNKANRNVSLYAEVFQASQHDYSWCLDSGASSHLCKDVEKFTSLNKNKTEKLHMANNSSADITGEGSVKVEVEVFGATVNVSLDDVSHVPDLRQNLLSVGQITDKGYEVHFEKNIAKIVDCHGNVELVANRRGNLYYMPEIDSTSGNKVDLALNSESYNSLVLWHNRLGHLNIDTLIRAEKESILTGLNINKPIDKFSCDICHKGKMSKLPFPKQSNRKTEILDIIHSDVCGPMRVQSNGKAYYMVTFIDDHSRWCEVRFIKSKNEVFSNFKEYVAMVENKTSKTVKSLQSDNGTEYVNKEFDDYLKRRGITRRLAVPYCSEQNGVSERKNRTILETTRCLLIQAKLPLSFWAEAANTANYIRNHCPSKSLNGRTPYEVWHGKKPNITYFKEFGCRAFCYNRDPKKGKLDPRCKEGIFLGYSSQNKGYRIWLTSERRVEITRHVKFLENRIDKQMNVEEKILENFELLEHPDFIEIEMSPQVNRENENPMKKQDENIETEQIIEEIQDEGIGNEQDVEEIQDIENEQVIEETQDEDEIQNVRDEKKKRTPGRPRLIRTGERGRPRKEYKTTKICENIEEYLEELNDSENIELENFSFGAEIPFKQAISSSDSSEWYEAMSQEIKSIIKNGTWLLTDRPKDKKIIGSRFVLTNKYNPDGTLTKRKARLVAQGYNQQPGIDFRQSFAPVARLGSIRLLTALAAKCNMQIRQFDIETAYLNGDLEEEVFLETPKDFKKLLSIILEEEEEDSNLKKECEEMLKELGSGDKVCLLKKALYGLRQAGRSWYKKLDSTLRKIGAEPCKSDPCVYKIENGNDLTFIIIFVDDILIISKDPQIIDKLEESLAKSFKIKNLGDVNYFLGMEFQRTDRKLHICQKGYINDILKRFGMSECKAVKTPIDINMKLTKNSEILDQEEENLPYRELVGSLLYLSIATRPDIGYATNLLSQFNNSYTREHWIAAKRVLRYLKGTMDIGITYNTENDSLQGFVDADWGGSLQDRHSCTGYLFTFSGGPISWESRKQRTVALSTTEAEYMAIADAVKEAIFLKNFFDELKIENSEVKIFSDNNGALKLTENNLFHSRTKHIDLRHHFVREALQNNNFKMEYLSTENMPADFLTKGVAAPKHYYCMEFLKMLN